MKRAFDIVVSTLMVLLSWPILLVLLVWICIESPGPAIFSQPRIGRSGRQFACYKLRTMYSGTANVPTHAMKPSAVTPLGGYLRRYKFDELPQLYNVLAGQMSLAGPRRLPSQMELIEARRRLGVLDVRPGITGLAQILGVDMSEPERLAKIDAEYVTNQSFLGDLRLIFATLFGKGVGIDPILRRNT